MPDLTPVKPGEPLRPKAETWNYLLEQAARLGGMTGLPVGDALPGSWPKNSALVRVLNNTGFDLDRFSIVGLDAPGITPSENLDEFQRVVIVSGVTPSVWHAGRFGILWEPIPAGYIGLAAVAGVSQVQVYMNDPGHRWADCWPGARDRLVSRGETGGAAILWAESTSGLTWALVLLRPTSALRAFEIDTDCLPDTTYVQGFFLDDPGQASNYLYAPADNVRLGVGRSGSPGTRGWAQWSATSGRYEIVWGGFKLIAEGRADSTIDADGTGSVSLWWAGEGGALEDSTLDVTARNVTDKAIEIETRVTLYYDRQENQWYCFPHEAGQARWIRFQLSEAMGYTDGSADASVLNFWDGSDPDPEEEGVVVVNCAVSGQNYLFGGDEGAIGLACYDPENDQYRIVQLECP